jgi:hypothetical protein
VEVSVCRWDDYEVSETTVDVGVPDVEVAGMPESLTPAEAGELACLLVRAADVLINGVAHRQVAG